MKNTFATLIAFALVMFAASSVSAKCYNFSDSPSDVYVCVGKDGSDSFDDRKKAKKICDEQTGTDCGNVSSYSSSCHSNSNKCYDENGKAHRSLKGY
jgi:hypothetical protein